MVSDHFPDPPAIRQLAEYIHRFDLGNERQALVLPLRTSPRKMAFNGPATDQSRSCSVPASTFDTAVFTVVMVSSIFCGKLRDWMSVISPLARSGSRFRSAVACCALVMVWRTQRSCFAHNSSPPLIAAAEQSALLRRIPFVSLAPDYLDGGRNSRALLGAMEAGIFLVQMPRRALDCGHSYSGIGVMLDF